MKVYRYWVRHTSQIDLPEGGIQQVVTFGHSNVSAADAQANGASQVEVIRKRIWGGESVSEDYVSPVREEMVRELSASDVVTCNRYGALVLNSTSVIFVDVDFATFTVPRELSFWQRLFMKNPMRAASPEEAVESVFATAGRVLGQSYCRIYRTCQGLRLLVVDDSCGIGTAEFGRLMTVFQADRLYASLCVKQACTRARLTPKPSRLHLKALKHVWPRTADEDAAVSAWRQGYVQASQGYAVCRFLGEIGKAPVSCREIVDYHDSMTKALSELPLA